MSLSCCVGQCPCGHYSTCDIAATGHGPWWQGQGEGVQWRETVWHPSSLLHPGRHPGTQIRDDDWCCRLCPAWPRVNWGWPWVPVLIQDRSVSHHVSLGSECASTVWFSWFHAPSSHFSASCSFNLLVLMSLILAHFIDLSSFQWLSHFI